MLCFVELKGEIDLYVAESYVHVILLETCQGNGYLDTFEIELIFEDVKWKALYINLDRQWPRKRRHDQKHYLTIVTSFFIF